MVLFPVSEIVLARLKHSDGRQVKMKDRGSMRLLWLSIGLGLGLAIAAQWVRVAQFPGNPQTIRLIALVLLLAGMSLRWAAILTLGRLFTVDVAIHADHVVFQHGVYRYMRHPSYTGLLVTFLGLGVSFHDWLSLLGVFISITITVMNRVVKEERALLDALGEEYAVYCAHTKRFIPGLI